MTIEGSATGKAVIMAIDVADYARFSAADEAGARVRLKAHRVAASPLREQYRGDIVGTDSDTLLLTFPDGIAGVQFARDLQHLMYERNAELPRRQRMLYRIGIHELDGGVLESAGAEAATALMALSEPGGICLSGPVHDGAKHKIAEQVSPVAAAGAGPTGRAFNIELEYEETLSDAAEHLRVKLRAKAPRYAIIAAAAVAVALAGIVTLVQKPWRTKVEPALAERMAYPLPQRPSLVVLPFVNARSGADWQWLADGFTEQITAGMAQEPALFVIARNSAARFAAAGADASPAQAAEALGVRYILRGTAEHREGNLRLEVTLIDAIDGYQMWSENFDEPIGKLFAVGAEIRAAIAGELDLEAPRAAGYAGDVQAFRLFTQGQRLFRRLNRDDNDAARALFEQATALDPGYGPAMVHLGLTHLLDAGLGWRGSRDAAFGKAQAIAAKMAKNAPNQAALQGLQSVLYVTGDNIGDAIDAGKKVLAASPNSAAHLALLGRHYRMADEYEKCAASMRAAMRLDPYYPDQYLSVLGDCFSMAGRFAEALPLLEEYQRRLIRRKSPNSWFGLMKLAWLNHKMGKENEATRYFRATKAMKPDLPEEAHFAPFPWKSDDPGILTRTVLLFGTPEFNPKLR